MALGKGNDANKDTSRPMIAHALQTPQRHVPKQDDKSGQGATGLKGTDKGRN